MKQSGMKIAIAVCVSLVLAFATLNTLLARPPEQQAACPGALPARLIVGEGGRVVPGSANNLRDQASTAGARLLQIPGGGGFVVLEGPVCADGYTWWRVNYNDLIGWTVEGTNAEYWLEPTGPLPTQSPTLTPPPVFTPTEVGAAACPGFMPSRLVVGEQARVVPGPANNLRSEPRSDAQLLGEIPGGALFIVHEGPLCLGGLAWWRVDYRGLSGWTVEGKDTVYWLEPMGPLPTQAPTLTPTITLTPFPTYTPSPTMTPAPVLPPVQSLSGFGDLLFAPLPADREVISADNLARLHPVSLVGGGGVQNVAVSPDGQTIAVLNSLGVWLNDGANPVTPGLFLETPNIRVNTFAFSPDSHFLALGSTGYPVNQDSTLQVWDVRLGTALDLFRDVRFSVSSVAFSPDGTLLATGGPDGIVRLWSMENGREIRELDDRAGYAVMGLAFSPDNNLLAFSNNAGYIRIWNVVSQQHQIEYQVSGGEVGNILFSPDSKLLMAAGWGYTNGSSEGLLRVWDIVTSRRLESVTFPNTIQQLTLSPDNTTLAVTDTATVWLLDMASRTVTTSWRMPVPVNGMVFAADNTHLIVGHSDGTVRSWDTASQHDEVLLNYDKLPMSDVTAISPDGSLIALAPHGDNVLRIWDATQRTEVKVSNEFSGSVSQVRFITHDQLVFVVEVDHAQYTWNWVTDDYTVDSIQPPSTPTILSSPDIYRVAVSLIPFRDYTSRQVSSAVQLPNSSIIALTDGSTLQFWDMNTRQPLALKRFFGTVSGFSTNGTVMVTYSDGVAWLWTVSP